MARDSEAYEELLERWFEAQAVLTPLLKSLLEAFQGEDHALLVLSRHPEGLSPSELMRVMGVTTGRISNILRQLEQKNLITRARSATDMRGVEITITAEGAARARTAYDRVKDQLRDQFALIGIEDAQELVRIIEKLAAATQEASSGKNLAV